jgi:pimeloyl-[acyl-carrier protein] methyl ester esterase
MIALFLHGWGFDRTMWEPLSALLGGFEQAFDDRGYFGEPLDPAPGGRVLAITHSFGTMRLLARPPAGLFGIVAINGFSHFAEGPAGAGVAPLLVERMIRRFDRDSQATVDRFRCECGAAVSASALDTGKLRGDLVLLATMTAPVPPVPLLSLEGAGDHLLDGATRAAQFAGARLERRIHPDAGHLLPCEDPAWCADAIRTFATAAA